MGSSYTNQIVPEEVSLAVEQIIIAPYGTAWTPGKVNVSSVPSGFYHLGAVVEDSIQVSVRKNMFELRTGLPQALQYQAVVGVDGTIQGRLYTHHNKKLEYVFGNVKPKNYVGTTSTTIASVTSKEIITLAGSPAAAWYVGDYVLVSTHATTTGISTFSNYAKISSINGATVVFASFTLDSTPAADQHAVKLNYSRIPFGTAQIRNFVVLGVADFIDGAQVIHYFGKVSAMGEWGEQFTPGAVPQMGFQFAAYSYTSSLYTCGKDEAIVGERFWFPPVHNASCD